MAPCVACDDVDYHIVECVGINVCYNASIADELSVRREASDSM